MTSGIPNTALTLRQAQLTADEAWPGHERKQACAQRRLGSAGSQLRLDPLHSPAADAHRPGGLQDADASRQVFLDGSLHLRATFGRPIFTPRALARSRPLLVRARMRLPFELRQATGRGRARLIPLDEMNE